MKRDINSMIAEKRASLNTLLTEDELTQCVEERMKKYMKLSTKDLDALVVRRTHEVEKLRKVVGLLAQEEEYYQLKIREAAHSLQASIRQQYEEQQQIQKQQEAATLVQHLLSNVSSTSIKKVQDGNYRTPNYSRVDHRSKRHPRVNDRK